MAESLPVKRLPDLTDEELREARRRGRELLKQPLVVKVSYEEEGDMLTFALNNGASLIVPRTHLQGLEGATATELREGRPIESGLGVEFESLDAHFLVEGLLAGVFGGQTWMRELARRGGLAKSAAKTAAARTNGKKGGRPRKTAQAHSEPARSV